MTDDVASEIDRLLRAWAPRLEQLRPRGPWRTMRARTIAARLRRMLSGAAPHDLTWQWPLVDLTTRTCVAAIRGDRAAAERRYRELETAGAPCTELGFVPRDLLAMLHGSLSDEDRIAAGDRVLAALKLKGNQRAQVNLFAALADAHYATARGPAPVMRLGIATETFQSWLRRRTVERRIQFESRRASEGGRPRPRTMGSARRHNRRHRPDLGHRLAAGTPTGGVAGRRPQPRAGRRDDGHHR